MLIHKHQAIPNSAANYLFSSNSLIEYLTYQLYIVGYLPTMAVTGNGELGFDSGEGAWEIATTSKEGSRRVNYPILTQRGSDKKYQCKVKYFAIGMNLDQKSR